MSDIHSSSGSSCKSSWKSVPMLFPKGRQLTYTGPQPEAVRQVLWSYGSCRRVLINLMKKGDCRIECIEFEARVQVFLLQSKDIVRPFLVKTVPADRVMDEAEQLGAEAKAAAVLGFADPVMCHPMKIDFDMQLGAMTIGVYAGDSLQQMLDSQMLAGARPGQRLGLAAGVVACILLARKHMDEVAPELGDSLMHRDVKPGNVCVRTVGDKLLATLIDFGACCRQDKRDCFSVVTLNALDPLLATVVSGRAAVQDPELARRLTHPTMDIYQAGLLFMQIACGGLPEALDSVRYDIFSTDPETAGRSLGAFLTAVQGFDWASCSEVQSLPKAAQSFVLGCLSADPRSRPQTGAEALAHPFMAAAAAEAQQAADAAADEWEESQLQLRVALADDAETLQVSVTTVATDSNDSTALTTDATTRSSSGPACAPAPALAAVCSTDITLTKDACCSSHSRHGAAAARTVLGSRMDGIRRELQPAPIAQPGWGDRHSIDRSRTA